MINVVWQSYHKETPTHGYWDMAMLDDVFAGDMWQPVNGFEFNHCSTFKELPKNADGAVVVLPARYHADDTDKLNDDIARLDWVVLLLVGDEESVFPIESVLHPNIKIWVMTPHEPSHSGKADRLLPNGYTPDTKMIRNNKDAYDAKRLDLFFSGQVTHQRRRDCVEVLEQMSEYTTLLNKTEGFTQGLPHDEYYSYMAAAKFVPCPSGAVMPDSFRVYEALEAGAIPLVDGRSPNYQYPTGFWTFLFGKEPPFPVVDQWENMPGIVYDEMALWPKNANKVFAWWQNYKRQMVYNLHDDIAELSKKLNSTHKLSDQITVLIPTSPIKSHPDTRIIDETIAQVRKNLPDCEIFLLIDGIREEQKYKEADYEEYKRRILWKCNYEWNNVLPIVFDSHQHQTGTARAALGKVRTPYILFVEHDAPITSDEPIDWNGLVDTLRSGEAYMIRLHHEARIHPEHRHLTLDEEPTVLCDVPFYRTIQWSQRPHLATVPFYNRILRDHFSEDAKSMIEDKMHAVVQNAYYDNGMPGWFDFRICIYAPGENIKRSYHLDGRDGEDKYEMKF